VRSRPRFDHERYSRTQAEVVVDTVTFVVCAGTGLAVSGGSVPTRPTGEDGALETVSEFAETIVAIARRTEDAVLPRGEAWVRVDLTSRATTVT
jgi:hypothetical protein